MITRFVSISIFSLAATLSLTAGQIQIGSGVNGSAGLTKSYVNPTATPTPASTISCAGATASSSFSGYNGCYVPPTAGTTLLQKNYQTNLFSNASPAATVPASPLSGGGATFSRISDSGADSWITNPLAKATTSSVVGTSDIVIPVGVYGVDKIWTLLNDFWGADGLVNTTVVFTFDDSSNGTGGTLAPTTETIALTNGQQIRSSVDYSSAGPVAKTCTTTYDDTGTGLCTSVGTAIATTLTSGPVTIGNAIVTAGSVFSSAYTSAAGSTGARQYAGTTGTVNLDYQLFDFGSLYTNEYLVSITIRGALASSQSGSAINQSRAALSAITVNSVATPEPSTVLLAFAGLGAVGYFRRRKA